ANKVYAACTHAVLSGPAIERLEESVIEKLIITDSIPLSEEKQIDKIEIVSIAPLFADAINRIYSNKSVSKLFK
ncbi:MAG: ribose-phosphate pyrophosphokinase, partial [Senegalia sp. (in: firmicutes)]